MTMAYILCILVMGLGVYEYSIHNGIYIYIEQYTYKLLFLFYPTQNPFSLKQLTDVFIGINRMHKVQAILWVSFLDVSAMSFVFGYQPYFWHCMTPHTFWKDCLLKMDSAWICQTGPPTISPYHAYPLSKPRMGVSDFSMLFLFIMYSYLSL